MQKIDILRKFYCRPQTAVSFIVARLIGSSVLFLATREMAFERFAMTGRTDEIIK